MGFISSKWTIESVYRQVWSCTEVKSGEVLYIPLHWFHYITSLQKSAQCNVRSGREFGGSPEFGSSADVLECVGEE